MKDSRIFKLRFAQGHTNKLTAMDTATAHGSVNDIGAVAQREDEEPLMAACSSKVLRAARPDLFSMYKTAFSAMWTPEELDLSTDRADFEDKLSDGERHFVKHILAFFADIDGLVFDNTRAFFEDVSDRSCQLFYGVQTVIEGVHAEAYESMIEALVRDQGERDRIARAIATMPVIAAKAAWVRKWMDAGTAPFGQRVLGFAIVERVTFCASFCAIGWLRKRNLLNGLGSANQFIMRDEGLHAAFGVLLLNKYVRGRPSSALILSMLREAVEIEERFVREALPVSLIGMNAELMVEYVHFVADAFLVSLGESKHYFASHPFEDWMAAMEMEGKANFFEHRPSEYAKHGVGVEQEKQQFALDEDF